MKISFIFPRYVVTNQGRQFEQLFECNPPENQRIYSTEESVQVVVEKGNGAELQIGFQLYFV